MLYGVTVLGAMVSQHRYESDTTPEEWEHVGEFMLVVLGGIVATVFLLVGLSRRSTAVACASMALAGLLGAVTLASRDVLAWWVGAALFALAFGFGGLALARTWPARPGAGGGRR